MDKFTNILFCITMGIIALNQLTQLDYFMRSDFIDELYKKEFSVLSKEKNMNENTTNN